MAMSIGDLFNFGGVNIGMGRIASVGAVILVTIFICILVGALVWLITMKRVYVFKIPVWKIIGNTMTRVGTYRAKSISVGRAGDQLWYVKGIKKYLPPGNLQSAPNEYNYFIREDGEWINFSLKNIDEEMKKANVKYIHQDMRMQRLATDRLLEQRLMQKSFWEKYQHALMTILFFIIIAISLVLFFYQFAKTADKVNLMLDKADSIMEKTCGGSTTSGNLVPIAALFAIPINTLRRRKWTYYP